MLLVYLYSGFLILGIFFSQWFDLAPGRDTITFLTDICLAYIMVEVGLEFIIYKKKWRTYIKDFVVAFSAATLPWFFCFLYFYFLFAEGSWKQTLLLSLFAAPTATGILFSMLAAAGLGLTWLFRKIQILAISDDIVTILFLVPLQFVFGGSALTLGGIVLFVVLLLFLAWNFLHRLRIPSGRLWILLYSFLLVGLLHWASTFIGAALEVILPSFVLGCLLFNPHDLRLTKAHLHEHAFIEAEERPLLFLDRFVKTVFMFLVGLLLPKIDYAQIDFLVTGLHVLAITLLLNLGKCVPSLCYRNEAGIRERIALSIGMFPRGEVGAGVLALAIELGAGGYASTIAGFSLALNLFLTGVFVFFVIRLIQPKKA